jgi:hypothetical protein
VQKNRVIGSKNSPLINTDDTDQEQAKAKESTAEGGGAT